MPEQRTGAPANATVCESRLYEIDLLRFFAALMVVLLHYANGYAHGESELDFGTVLGPVTRYGYLGVDLFFMISGLVVFMSLWGRSPIAFLISRVSRLYPAYWVAVAITTLVVIGLGTPRRDRIPLNQFLVNLTMFPAPFDVPYVESVYWTLWSEWRFYALLFLFSLIGLTYRRTHLFLWGWLVGTVGLQAAPLPDALRHTLALGVQPLYSHYFIAGMVLYLMHRSGWTRNLVLLLLGSYLHAVYQAVHLAEHRNQTDRTGLNLTVVAVGVTVIFLMMTLVASGSLARWRSRALLPLGEMTYPLYLIHATVGYALFNLCASVINQWVLLVGVTIAMCAGSLAISRLVEARLQPVLRGVLTRWWSSALGATAARSRPAARITDRSGKLSTDTRPVVMAPDRGEDEVDHPS